jgi:hypothetical protein
MRYYTLKMGLYAMYLGIRIKTLFGFQVSQDELQDFELDVTHAKEPSSDSLMGLALSSPNAKHF